MLQILPHHYSFVGLEVKRLTFEQFDLASLGLFTPPLLPLQPLVLNLVQVVKKLAEAGVHLVDCVVPTFYDSPSAEGSERRMRPVRRQFNLHLLR